MEELSRSWQYGDSEAYDLRQAIAESTGIPSDRLVIGNGIDDLLRRATRLLIDIGSAAVATAGTYPLFGRMVADAGGLLWTVPYREGFGVDPDALGTAARAKHAQIVYVANPDNPTGSALAESELLQLDSQLPDSCLLILDEAYAEYAGEGIFGGSLTRSLNGALRLRTFSKIHGLAGLRIGYAILPADRRLALDGFEQLGVNRVGQAAARAAILDRCHPARVLDEIARGKEQYAIMADRLDWRYIPSHANFVSFDPGGLVAAETWCREILAAGVFVRRGFIDPLDAYIRVTIGTKAERDHLEEVLGQIARAKRPRREPGPENSGSV
jgi:histidinol-phosphate aminotransferase